MINPSIETNASRTRTADTMEIEADGMKTSRRVSQRIPSRLPARVSLDVARISIATAKTAMTQQCCARIAVDSHFFRFTEHGRSANFSKLLLGFAPSKRIIAFTLRTQVSNGFSVRWHQYTTCCRKGETPNSS